MGTIGCYVHGSGKRGRTGRAGALVSLVPGKWGDAKPPLDVSSRVSGNGVKKLNL